MTQKELLLAVNYLVHLKKPWPTATAYEMFKVIFYAHTKGWLYAALDSEGVLDMVAIMYRVPEYKQEESYILPEEENGDILYVPMFLSVSEDKMRAMKLFKKILKSMPEVKRVKFEHRGSYEDIREYNKEKIDEQSQKTRNKRTGIPRGSEVPAGHR